MSAYYDLENNREYLNRIPLSINLDTIINYQTLFYDCRNVIIKRYDTGYPVSPKGCAR